MQAPPPATSTPAPAGARHTGMRHGLFPRNPLRHLRLSDLRGLAQIATQAGVELARLAEELEAAWRPVLRDAAGAPPPVAPAVPPRRDPRLDPATNPYGGLPGFVRLSGQGLDALLAGVEPWLEATGRLPAETPERAAVLAALNALAGDRLADARNPLATRMTLLHRGQALRNHQMPPLTGTGRRLVLLVHGLGMNEAVWQAPAGRGMGDALAAGLDCTVLHLRYNTGRHVSDNARELGGALEQLVLHWAAPPAELAIVAHGMGGLVARSAVWLARQHGRWHWPERLRHLVFLGTPHQGLAAAGAAASAHAPQWPRPLAPLAAWRSAGWQDQQRGVLAEADWQAAAPFAQLPEPAGALPPPATPVPLPEGIACCTVAGTLSRQRETPVERLHGDGLVPVASALGRHPDPRRQLVFAREAQHIAWRTHHLMLPRSPEVARRVITWLQAGG